LRGYLLDTCIIEYWYDQQRPEHARVIKRVNALPSEAPLRISVITLGEIEYGHRCVSSSDSGPQAQFKRFLHEKFPVVLDIKRSTVKYYGELRAEVFKKFAPAKRRRKGLRPEQLVDPVSSLELGIQENDLWIAALAYEYNLVLATGDKMTRIKQVASSMVKIEDWTN